MRWPSPRLTMKCIQYNSVAVEIKKNIMLGGPDRRNLLKKRRPNGCQNFVLSAEFQLISTPSRYQMSWLTNSSSHTFRLKVTAITLMLVIFWHVPCTPSGTDPQIVPLKCIKCHDHLNKGVPTRDNMLSKLHQLKDEIFSRAQFGHIFGWLRVSCKQIRQ